MSDGIPTAGEQYIHAIKTIESERRKLRITEAALDAYARDNERLRAALQFYADTYGPGTELGDPAHNALNNLPQEVSDE